MSWFTAAVMRIFVRVKAIISNDLNLAALRRQHGAQGDTVVRIDVFEDRARTRKVFTAQYKVTDNGLVEMPLSIEPNAISQTDYDTIVNLIKGERTYTYQGKKFTEHNYNSVRAVAEGRVTITQVKNIDGYLADVDLFEEIYEKVLPKLRDTIGKQL